MNKGLFGAVAGCLVSAGLAGAQMAPGYGYGYPQPAPGWYGANGVPAGYAGQMPMRPMMPGAYPQGPVPTPPQYAPYANGTMQYRPGQVQGYPMMVRAPQMQQAYRMPQVHQVYSMPTMPGAVRMPAGATMTALGPVEKLATPGGRIEHLPTPGSAGGPITSELPAAPLTSEASADCPTCTPSKKSSKLFGSKKDKGCDGVPSCYDGLLAKYLKKSKKDDECAEEKCKEENWFTKMWKKGKKADECVEEACHDKPGKHHGKDECFHHPWFIAGEYLHWKIKDGVIATPLATTGPDGLAAPGVFGAVGGSTVIGDINQLNLGTFSGGKITTGRWLCPEEYGIEMSGFLLEDQIVTFAAGNNPGQVLSRPFFDTLLGAENVRVLTSPALAQSGGLIVRHASRLWGAEANPFCRVCNHQCVSVDVLAGFRYLDLEETLRIQDTTATGIGGTFNAAPVGPGAITSVRDTFDTRNQFYGGQLGMRLQAIGKCWVIDVTGKIAGGTNHQTVNIFGTSTLTGVVPATVTVPGGLLAVATNSGRRRVDDFALLPEGSINVSYRLSDYCTLNGGYSILYLNKVMRPGDQLNRQVNPTLVPTNAAFGQPLGGVLLPGPIFSQSDFYAHGLNIGLALIF